MEFIHSLLMYFDMLFVSDVRKIGNLKFSVPAPGSTANKKAKINYLNFNHP